MNEITTKQQDTHCHVLILVILFFKKHFDSHGFKFISCALPASFPPMQTSPFFLHGYIYYIVLFLFAFLEAFVPKLTFVLSVEEHKSEA